MASTPPHWSIFTATTGNHRQTRQQSNNRQWLPPRGMMKALKDISKSHKKSTSTRAPVAEPSLFISEKPKGKSETHVEEFKDFSDSLPIFDESDEEPIESLMTCENKRDIPSLEPEFVTDIKHAIVELTILQPEHPSSLVLSPQVFEE
ncbi:hypothetical protein DY000_02029953 [Brassica cretica]|uniref:Uncharacterized protein n=1 Tax=Brassica cretica TaxID=69181 RepID=A0ABQ7DTM9_BRACR|nr:hypothetical protein DY000_02029953 [Brassica cretica]